MLFRTVYGPELEAIYSYLSAYSSDGLKIPVERVYMMFLADDQESSRQPVDDALSFLVSTGLVDEEHGTLWVTKNDQLPFGLQVLKALQELQSGQREAQHPLDRLYGFILNEVFIRPDIVYVDDLHARANELRAVKENGGLSKEKIQAWKRVMEFLGVGHRAFGGFMCVYSPNLLRAILTTWSKPRSTLQSFFEQHFVRYLPYARADGEVATAASTALSFLERHQAVSLFTMQDSPSKTYFGARRLRGIGLGIYSCR